MDTPFWVVNTLLILITTILLLYKLSTKNFDYWKVRNIFYIKPLPLFGNFYPISTFKITTGEYLAKLYNQTKEPFFGIFVFNIPHLIIRSPELVKTILVKDFNYFTDRTITSSQHDVLSSEMLFISKNPDWKNIRTKITPVFTSGKLKAMFPLINNVGKEMVQYLDKIVTDKSVEAKEVCAKFSTDVIAKCAFAISAHSFEREDADFRKMGRLAFDFRLSTAIQQTSFFFLPRLAKIFRMKLFDPQVTTFLETVFWKAIDQREKNNVKGNDLIDIIIEIRKNKQFVTENNFEGKKVVAQAAQFFVAGFETTSSTIGFTLYELCIHPEIQQRVREEIKECIKTAGITYEAIQNMKYLNMCICETLRKYPVLPFLDRRCNENYKIPGSDVIIEKGTPIYIPMFGLHYDPEFFPNPQAYDPERFEKNNDVNLKGFSYIPFGEGPRNCIGERFGLLGTKVGLVHILSEFEISRSADTPVPLVYEPKSFILQSKVGLPMKFKKSPIIV